VQPTSPTKEELLALIYAAIDEFNASALADQQLEKTPEAALFGAQGKMDSLSLVHLIVALEEQVWGRTGLALALADEKAFSQTRSPFRDVGALLVHLGERLKESADGR